MFSLPMLGLRENLAVEAATICSLGFHIYVIDIYGHSRWG
jgi:hypothetical protein